MDGILLARHQRFQQASSPGHFRDDGHVAVTLLYGIKFLENGLQKMVIDALARLG